MCCPFWWATSYLEKSIQTSVFLWSCFSSVWFCQSPDSHDTDKVARSDREKNIWTSVLHKRTVQNNTLKNLFLSKLTLQFFFHLDYRQRLTNLRVTNMMVLTQIREWLSTARKSKTKCCEVSAKPAEEWASRSPTWNQTQSLHQGKTLLITFWKGVVTGLSHCKAESHVYIGTSIK